MEGNIMQGIVVIVGRCLPFPARARISWRFQPRQLSRLLLFLMWVLHRVFGQRINISSQTRV